MDINVTSSFFGLSENVRKCQKKELYEKCLLNANADKMIKECGCLPLHLTMEDQVSILP